MSTDYSMGKCGGLNYAGRNDTFITGNYDNLNLSLRTKPDYPQNMPPSPVDGIKLTSDQFPTDIHQLMEIQITTTPFC